MPASTEARANIPPCGQLLRGTWGAGAPSSVPPSSGTAARLAGMERGAANPISPEPGEHGRPPPCQMPAGTVAMAGPVVGNCREAAFWAAASLCAVASNAFTTWSI